MNCGECGAFAGTRYEPTVKTLRLLGFDVPAFITDTAVTPGVTWPRRRRRTEPLRAN